eukprot:gene18060-19869_t
MGTTFRNCVVINRTNMLVLREYSAVITNNITNKSLKAFNASDNSLSSSSTNWGAISVLLGSLVLLANSIVIYTFLKRRSLFRQPTNKLLFSLSLSDFASGLAVFLHAITLVLPNLRHPVTSSAYTYRVMTELITTTLQLTTLFHLCCLTMDRYIALLVALRYREIASGKRMIRLIIAAWLCSGLIASIQLTWLYRVLDAEISVKDGAVLDLVECRYSIFVLVVFVLLPLLIIGAMFFRMLLETQRLLRNPVTHMRPALKKEVRITWVYTTMYILICIHCLPYFVMRLLIDLKAVRGEVLNINPFIVNLAANFKYLIHLANPMIYALRKKDIKKAVCAILVPTARVMLCRPSLPSNGLLLSGCNGHHEHEHNNTNTNTISRHSNGRASLDNFMTLNSLNGGIASHDNQQLHIRDESM